MHLRRKIPLKVSEVVYRLNFVARLLQMSSNQPQIPTRIPQTSMEQPHRSIVQQQYQTQIQQPSQIPRTQTRIPQGPISQIPRRMSTSKIPRTQLQIDIEKYKNKLAMASNVKQFGNSQNLRQSEAIKNQQRTIPQRVVHDKSKQLTANLKISNSIGNVRKVKARPMNEAARKFLIVFF